MKILWVKANKLLPTHSGGDIRSFNILRQLGKRHEVVLFSYYDGSRDPQYESELKRQLPGSVCVYTGKRESALRRGFEYLLQLPRAEPYAVSRFASSVVRERLRSCISQNSPGVVIADFLDAAINLPPSLYSGACEPASSQRDSFQAGSSRSGSSRVPVVLFQHNVESEIWRRHAMNASGWVMRLVYGLESSRMLRYEHSTVQNFHHVIAVSEHDKKLMSAWVEPSRVTVVPTGVDTEQFCPGPPVAGCKPLVLFVGAMDWEPNVDAVKYFSAEIWPSILARVPEARFRIVGRNPDGRVNALAGDSVEVTGRVASVVEHLREAVVVVVPLRIGGGTRLKIYEAMAVGKAVVSTSVGAEGLDVHPGKDVILADAPGIFAESVVTLLQDGEARMRQGAAAAELARNYAWPVIANRFAEVLQHVVAEQAVERSSRPALASALTES